MKGQFFPYKATLKEADFIDELLKSAASLEQFVCAWVGRGRVLTFFKQPDLPSGTIGIGFTKKKRAVGFICLPVSALKNNSGWTPLNEEIVATDTEEFWRPDDHWFTARNIRLGVTAHNDLTFNYAPPEAFYELVMSYACSSQGFARVSCAKRSYADDQLYHLELVFLGAGDGWCEDVVVSKAALKNYEATLLGKNSNYWFSIQQQLMIH